MIMIKFFIYVYIWLHRVYHVTPLLLKPTQKYCVIVTRTNFYAGRFSRYQDKIDLEWPLDT